MIKVALWVSFIVLIAGLTTELAVLWCWAIYDIAPRVGFAAAATGLLAIFIGGRALVALADEL